MTSNLEHHASDWLATLKPALTPATDADLVSLSRFECELADMLVRYPVRGDVEPGLRTEHLRQIRLAAAASGYLGLAVPSRTRDPAVLQWFRPSCSSSAAIYDVDLRDSTGFGHGRLIAGHASPPLRDRWIPRMRDGAVSGIAVTEPHGGSQVHALRTRAVASRDGTWVVTGMKTWISRLAEAAVFCLFFAGPDGEISVAAIDARAEGLTRVPLVPAGLSGWTWGELHLDRVRIRPEQIIGQPGTGIRLLREHFSHYRPLVTATALGAAAGCHDRTVAILEARRRSGSINRLRDNALITLGRTYAEINAALLAACNASTLAEFGSPFAASWGCAVKAYGVDVAHRAVSELALLTGASGFVASSATAKAVRDLNALLYADGIHDSLYRAAGHALTAPGTAVHISPQSAVALASD